MMHPYFYAGINGAKQRQYIANRYVNQAELAEAIKTKILQWFGITDAEASSRSRKRQVVNCRQVCMYFIKQKTTLSLQAIGDMFGGRDHSSVIYSVKIINDLLAVDRQFSKSITEVEHLLGQENIYKKEEQALIK